VGTARTLPLVVGETVNPANSEMRKRFTLTCSEHSICLEVNEPTEWQVQLERRLTESLDVQGVLVLVLDQIVDLKAIWGRATWGVSTRDDDVRHA